LKISNESKVGALTAVGIAVLILGYNFIMGRNLFVETKVAHAVYKNVDGLKKSNPVILHGYQIGKVDELQMLSPREGKILVSLNLDKEIDIPKGSVARIINSDLLGSKAVEILPSDNSIMIQNGDTLLADNELSISESLAKVIDPVRKKTVSLMTSIDTVINIFKKIMNEGGKANLQKSLGSLERSLRNLEANTIKIDTIVNKEATRIANIIKYTESITKNLEANNDELTNAINNFSSISDTLAAADLYSTIRQTDTALNQLSTVVGRIERGEGSLGLLLKDDQLYYNLEQSSSNLDRLIIDLRKNPDKYVNFSILKIGKNKDND